MTNEELMQETVDQLTERYNTLANLNGADPIATKWKNGKEALIEKLRALIKIDTKRLVEIHGTIRENCLNLMCEAVYFEDRSRDPGPDNRVAAGEKNAFSVGYAYSEIIEKIKEIFPYADTTAACLRWYAVKVRGGEFGYEGYKLAQRRPRTAGK